MTRCHAFRIEPAGLIARVRFTPPSSRARKDRELLAVYSRRNPVVVPSLNVPTKLTSVFGVLIQNE
ncbi:MAG TPA: hypothetical protein PLA65_15480, partial [Spirochaetota bacterium]|nr:hypothetical protein [Spirochaetota bacterium]